VVARSANVRLRVTARFGERAYLLIDGKTHPARNPADGGGVVA